MDKGYIENGFIVDVSNANKTSEIIYELSRILDLPDAQCKKVCLKLGSVDLSTTELISIKALVESMNSEIEFISTNSDITAKSADELNIEVSVFENNVPTPEFDADQEKVNQELEKALDKIFGNENSEIKTFGQEKELKELKKAEQEHQEKYQTPETVNDVTEPEKQSDTTITEEIEINEKGVVEDAFQKPLFENQSEHNYEEFNSKLENANEINGDDIKEIDYNLDDIRKQLRETEKLPTLYIQRTLRSGQSIKSEGNIVIIGDVNPGSEVIAKGDITVWGILGGIAQAGSDGNTYARIRALKMNAIQLRIADTFARRPDSINIPYIQKTDTFVPEEACVRKKQIIIHKMHES